jgi:hypothetical protein
LRIYRKANGYLVKAAEQDEDADADADADAERRKLS